jgi:hypothetical protein
LQNDEIHLGQAATPEYQDEAPPSRFFRADFIRHQLIKQSREALQSTAIARDM